MPENIQELRNALLDAAHRLAARGLVPGTTGNVSLRIPGTDRFLITPTGIPYDVLHASDMVEVNLQGAVVEGNRKPSSETPLHTRIYHNHPWAGAVVHTHSMFATTFAVLNEAIPAVHYVIAGMGTDIPVAQYATYGSEDLAVNAAELISPEQRAILLQNHGVITVGGHLEEALHHAETVEYLAELYYRSRSIGSPNILPEEEIRRVAEKFKTYGQR
ncbi:class II aldolase/adducin family protein [Kyrpidia tusciae]|uniref:Class II aldolase/adducin family protein n=1 Tax=Kyrpidia tusciae (strain DSM 2912 / NBRC 15312 / T2) TaxID=562970 RepID=D5WVW4_KYRT2|nr:class II aldolase/adducin family protein [Kyrpidia tusciae]ADG07657.1 class II aldolase/adducin family protein [Kyrpidia tusciae DSM 2912]